MHDNTCLTKCMVNPKNYHRVCEQFVAYRPVYYTAMQIQKAVSAYFTSKQLMHFAFKKQHSVDGVGWV